MWCPEMSRSCQQKTGILGSQKHSEVYWCMAISSPFLTPYRPVTLLTAQGNVPCIFEADDFEVPTGVGWARVAS